MKEIKIVFTTIVTALMSWLGILAIPVFLLVGCNIIDYTTGIIAAGCRSEEVNSYKGIKGIAKKVCMWFLIVVGAIMDVLINYAIDYVGIAYKLPFVVAIAVSVWLICNEIISILENMADIGVAMPSFLMPLVKLIRKQVEEKSTVKEEEKNG